MRVPYIALLIFSIISPSINAQDLPNVVIIYADDMGYGDLEVNNTSSKIPTPNLNKLATQGMRFTDGHSSSGICTPSRFSLLTGQHHWRRFHRIVPSFGGSVFKPDDFTLAKMFRSKGYKTAAIGKWHLGWDWESLKKEESTVKIIKGKRKRIYSPKGFDWTKPIPNGPLSQGFDYYYGDGTINFPPYCFIENDRIVEAPSVMMNTDDFKKIPEGEWEFRPGPMVKDWNPYQVLPKLTHKAVDWINGQKKQKPFFLYFALPSPHAPIIPNDEFRGKSKAGAYGDFVYETDAMAGKIIEALEKNGLSENTIVIFSADNGSEKYAYERLQKYGHWSSGKFRGLKRDMWEGGHRVPFIVKWPGKIKANTVSKETINQVDIAATLANVIDYKLTAKEAIDSYNFTPLLKGKKCKTPIRYATVQNTFEKAYTLRKGNWVYMNVSTGEHTASPEWFNKQKGYTKETTAGLLFNIKKDPTQHKNLYTKKTKIVSEMDALLKRYINGEGCAPHSKL